MASRRLPSDVRIVNVAGEALPAVLVEETFARADGLQAMFNLYGPSEDTTYSTFTPVEPGAPPLIGKAVSNSRVFILDACGMPAPQGVPGEIFIAGAGLARGYWDRPELTAERFVPDSLSREPGARMYRTGDLGRWTASGDIEYLGRLDHQVKIRGHRIELGEIEACSSGTNRSRRPSSSRARRPRVTSGSPPMSSSRRRVAATIQCRSCART